MLEFPIIDKLGGREAVFHKLKARGVTDAPTTIHALRMWVRRGQIPGNTQTALMSIAESEKVAYSSSDFVPRENNELAA